MAYLTSELSQRLALNYFWSGMADDYGHPPISRMSVFSAMLSVSSNSTPRYPPLLSTLLSKSRSRTACRLPILRLISAAFVSLM